MKQSFGGKLRRVGEWLEIGLTTFGTGADRLQSHLPAKPIFNRILPGPGKSLESTPVPSRDLQGNRGP
jgi:hypothetical protein